MDEYVRKTDDCPVGTYHSQSNRLAAVIERLYPTVDDRIMKPVTKVNFGSGWSILGRIHGWRIIAISPSPAAGIIAWNSWFSRVEAGLAQRRDRCDPPKIPRLKIAGEDAQTVNLGERDFSGV